MSPYIYSILLALIFLGVSTVVAQRVVLWSCMLAVLMAVHLLHLSDSPIVRMFVLCSVLLLCMKGIVLAEWGKRLRLWRWLGFTFFWFGMDPSPFAGHARKLSWGRDGLIGVACLIAGLLLSVAVGYTQFCNIFTMFIPLSLCFHFGVLRLLTAFWRMQGIAVRPLFRNPFSSNGLAEFWARRWNLSYSQMMARAVQRPLSRLLGERQALFAVFLMSGLLHEIAISVPVQSGYGLPTLYFLLHGMLVLLENETWPLWLRRGLLWVFVVAPLPILFPAAFTDKVIRVTLDAIVNFLT